MEIKALKVNRVHVCICNTHAKMQMCSTYMSVATHRYNIYLYADDLPIHGVSRDARVLCFPATSQAVQCAAQFNRSALVP